jgi:heat shock protein HslJ
MKNTLRKFSILLGLAAGILIVSCKTAPKTPLPAPVFSDVIGKEWKLSEVRSSAAASRFSRQELVEIGMGNAYTLRFDEERLAGMGAPNRYFAPYEPGEEQALSIKLIASTEMASFRDPESLKEREYFAYLQNVNKWDLVQGKLQLHSVNVQGEETVLVFE